MKEDYHIFVYYCIYNAVARMCMIICIFDLIFLFIIYCFVKIYISFLNIQRAAIYICTAPNIDPMLLD